MLISWRTGRHLLILKFCGVWPPLSVAHWMKLQLHWPGWELKTMACPHQLAKLLLILVSYTSVLPMYCTLDVWPKKISHQLFNQWEAKSKLMASCTWFFHSEWFIVLFILLWFFRASITLVLILWQSFENCCRTGITFILVGRIMVAQLSRASHCHLKVIQ